MFGRRRYRRNALFSAVMPSIKMGLYVLGGFIVHKALTRAIGDYGLAQLSVFADGTTLGNWRRTIAGLVSGAVLIPVAAKVMPARAVEVGSGVVASFLHELVLSLVGMTGQTQALPYLSGFGDIPSARTTFWGSKRMPLQSYEPVGGFGVMPYAQAAAGYGQSMYPVQAAAGMGVMPYAQAAAGYGLAEYEPVGGMTFDGIHGDQMSAEKALNAADKAGYPVQAAAGYGNIPSESIWMPNDPTAAVGGFGEGIFTGTSVLGPPVRGEESHSEIGQSGSISE